MSYKVLARFQDEDGRIYVKGERYSKELDQERENVLTSKNNKYRKPFLKPLNNHKPSKSYPHHTGGGWYELSNGERVQGKEEAIEKEGD